MKETLSIADFQKLDIRIGRIEAVELVEGLDRLYKLTVDLGPEFGRRTLLAGVKNYAASQLVGRKIVVVVNLEPKVVKGVTSEGMLLAADPSTLQLFQDHPESIERATISGQVSGPVILIPEKDVPEGTLVR